VDAVYHANVCVVLDDGSGRVCAAVNPAALQVCTCVL